MNITSSAFTHEARIPEKYTCKGENVSPPLKVQDTPEKTASLALIMDDPDAPAGTFTHWVLWNVPATTTTIHENRVPMGTMQGLNDFGTHDYGGPCPPSGEHRYYFRLYALAIELDLPESSRKEDVEQAMDGHIVAKAVLMGKYSKGNV